MLKSGSRGSDVRSLQKDCVSLGFGSHLGKHGCDGVFGNGTKESVMNMQKWLGVKIDGIVGKETKNAMNKAKNNAGRKGTFNFNINEFKCKGTGKMLASGMHYELLLKLEELGYLLGNKPMVVTSGYRTATHNKAVGGASGSQHLYGRASDIKVKNVSPSEVYRVANIVFAHGGVGKYSTFTHVDVRGYKARF